jgi:shikimate kinase
MIILQGMCYAGKTTLGAILARKLQVPFLDSRDLFQQTYRMSETEYLRKFGRDMFCKAERETLTQSFGDIVLSLGGSACYYDTEMEMLDKSNQIIWLDVSLNEIEKRMRSEGALRPVVYPEGIISFKHLYTQRRLLYEKYYTIKIEVNNTQKPITTVNSIMDKLVF